MSQQVYIDKILMSQLSSHGFKLTTILFSGLGPGRSKIVRTWKEQIAWNLTLRKFPHWDDATTKELIYEGWTHVTPKLINEKVASMPERLQAVSDGEGK